MLFCFEASTAPDIIYIFTDYGPQWSYCRQYVSIDPVTPQERSQHETPLFVSIFYPMSHSLVFLLFHDHLMVMVDFIKPGLSRIAKIIQMV